MMKLVRYNGGTESYYGCSAPTELVIGKEYEVIAIHDRSWQTDYTLKGVRGSFNSCWFEEVVFDSAPTFMALAHTVPTIGKGMQCYKIEFSNNKPQLHPWCTTPVKAIQVLGNNIYQVSTVNSTYIVKVG